LPLIHLVNVILNQVKNDASRWSQCLFIDDPQKQRLHNSPQTSLSVPSVIAAQAGRNLIVRTSPILANLGVITNTELKVEIVKW